MALAKKLWAMPEDAIKSPLITGPIIRPDEITALFNATAFGKSASPTRSLTKLNSAGLSMHMMRPKLKRICDSKRQAGISQLQDQPILSRDLNPGADIGSDLCCEIDTEIWIAETNECCGKPMGQDLSLFCHDQTSPVLAQFGKWHSPENLKVQLLR